MVATVIHNNRMLPKLLVTTCLFLGVASVLVVRMVSVVQSPDDSLKLNRKVLTGTFKKVLEPGNVSREAFPPEWLNPFANELDSLVRHPNFSWPLATGHWPLEGNRKRIHVIIKDNGLFVGNKTFPKPHATLFQLQRVLCLYNLPDMEIYINAGDSPLIRSTSDVVYPVFSWSKSASYMDLLMPYWSFVWAPWCESMHNDTPHLQLHNEYASKIDKAYWRGTTTGGRFTKEGWRNKTRARLALTCQEHQDVCDAGFVGCSQCTRDAASEIEEVLGYLPREPAENFQKYKMAILIDGNSAPSSRSRTYFLSRTLILWQKTKAWEFFYHSLQPYVHYVPLSENICDLVEKIREYLADTASAESIIHNQIEVSKQFCADKVTAYMASTLSLYASRVAQSNLDPHKQNKVQFLSKLKEFPHQYRYFTNYMGERCLLD